MEHLTNFSNKSFFKDYKKHRYPVVAELISTEEEYIKKLEQVVCGYMIEYYDKNSEIPIPEELKEHNGFVIFANIADIYEWHKHYFLGALQQNQHSIRGLSTIFTQNKHHFHMHAKFSFNKSISNYLISKNLNYFDRIKKKLNHKETIEDLIIEPVQRVTRYALLLEALLKHLIKNDLIEDIDYLKEAWNMMKEVCNEVQEFITLNGIKNFDGLISAQGKLLYHGFLKCSYNGKRSNLYVFLFKCLILFTEKQGPEKKYVNPSYIYRLQIPMNKLKLRELNGSKFALELMDPNSPSCSVICYSSTKDEQQKWIQAIKQQLALQMNLIHDLVNPNNNYFEEREVL